MKGVFICAFLKNETGVISDYIRLLHLRVEPRSVPLKPRLIGRFICFVLQAETISKRRRDVCRAGWLEGRGWAIRSCFGSRGGGGSSGGRRRRRRRRGARGPFAVGWSFADDGRPNSICAIDGPCVGAARNSVCLGSSGGHFRLALSSAHYRANGVE